MKMISKLHICTCARPNYAQLTPNWRPTAYSWAHKWPRVMMPFIKINRPAIISGWPLAFTSLRWPMRQRQMIGMLHPALKLLSWFFRWPLQNILYDNSGFGPRWNNSQTDIRIYIFIYFSNLGVAGLVQCFLLLF